MSDASGAQFAAVSAFCQQLWDHAETWAITAPTELGGSQECAVRVDRPRAPKGFKGRKTH